MPPTLAHQSYGKSSVRVSRIDRHDDRHDFIELSVDVALEGDFDATYLTGDNASVVATDSIKNTVYVHARNHAIESVERFTQTLAEHFVTKYAHVSSAEVAAREHRWHRATVGGQPHAHTFLGSDNEQATAVTRHERDKHPATRGGIDRLMLLKTTDSGFVGYVMDEFTTLKETTDRIFATSMTADWAYNAAGLDYGAARDTIRTALIETFADHHSLSVQQTLFAMGGAAFDACPHIDRITLAMPNKHHLLVNLEPLGRDNPNVVFQVTDEPFGDISATLSRDA